MPRIMRQGRIASWHRLVCFLFSSDQGSRCCRVTKVREFQRVAKLCEADGHMQQKLKQLLKLSKEKWDAACEHAKTAVQVSSIMNSGRHHDVTRAVFAQCVNEQPKKRNVRDAACEHAKTAVQVLQKRKVE